MDNAPGRFITTFASNAPKSLSKIGDAGVAYSAITALQLDSPVMSSSYFSNSKGSKRKWSVNDGSANLQDGNLQDGFLFFGLGHSSSSCISTTALKEVEEESSVDLGLRMNLHHRNERRYIPKDISHGTPKALELERPKLVLELSLSTGPAESDVTTVTHGVTPFSSNAESSVTTGTIQLVDEGSTSSRWKLGPLVPPLQALQSAKTSAPFDHVQNHANPTTVITNLKSTTVDVQKGSVACSSGVVHQQQRRNTGVKICQFNGCIRGARGASGLCIAHGGGRRCQKAGCQKGAEGKTVFCKAHGGGRRCQHLGCTRSAEGRTEFCIGHGGGRRCSHDDCSRAARGKSGLCIRHGGGKRCKIEDCSKSAEGVSGLCISHGGGRRCQYTNCTKGAQGSTKFCKAHGGGKRCTELGCTKGAEGSTPFCKGHGGGKRCSFEGGCTKSVHGGTLFCVNHGGGKRCAMPECTKSARGRTNFCVRHGGGKRCKFDGCGKSAQGSTDFCKAHGGGKRCCWAQVGSEFGARDDSPCDKFARGKSGLCAAHSAQVQNKQIHGGVTSGATLQEPQTGAFEKTKATSFDFMGYGSQLTSVQNLPQEEISAGNACLVQFSLPEGRVHGGNLMAMLRGGTNFGGNNINKVVGGPSEPEKSYMMPHSWV